MNKYHRNIISILLIMMIALFSFVYWLDLSFGYGQMILILGGGYGIYLNFKAIKKEQEPT